MTKGILFDIDTLSLGCGFFLHHDKLYFFTREELDKIQEDCFNNLKYLF